MFDFEMFRKANKKTQVEFADYFGCTQGFISQLELGKRPMPDDLMSKIIADNSLKGKEYIINTLDVRKFRKDNNLNFMSGKELREKLLSAGVVLSELSAKLDITHQTLNSRLNAKSIKSDFLKEIEGLTGLNLNENKIELNNYRLVPVYNLDAVGGVNNSEIDTCEYITDYIPFKNAKENDIAIPITNNSMSPTYPPGCLVQIREVADWQTYLEYGQVYVIELEDDRRLLKQIRKGIDNEHYRLVSFNDDYDDTEVEMNFIRRIYLVLAKYQKTVM